MMLSCDCCGLCCQHLIVEAGVVDVMREPRIDAERPIGRRAPGLSILDACCGIYATRPNTCVAFIAGSPKCLELRQEFGRPKRIPQPVTNPMVAEIIEAAIADKLEDSDSA